MSDVLTRDKAQLSRLTPDSATVGRARAVDCTIAVTEQVAGYVAESLSANSRRAYLSDLAQFGVWGGTIPCGDAVVASYLAAHAEILSAATLVRRLASISKGHAAKGFPTPTRSELVRATLRGIRRRLGSARNEAKPLMRDDLFRILDAMGNGLSDVRDRALLLVGFAGGFRRSELVAIDVDAVDFVRQGAVITIRRSKTDQTAEGRKVGIPLGRTQHCPVTALATWIARAGITDGPVYRPINRHGCVAGSALSGEAVSLIVKKRLVAACIPVEGYSGHSLRAGLATSAAQAGVSALKIKAQTGHASDTMLNRYIRNGQLFADNAAGALL